MTDIFQVLNAEISTGSIVMPEKGSCAPIQSSFSAPETAIGPAVISANEGPGAFPVIPSNFLAPAKASTPEISAVVPLSADRSDRLEKLVDDALTKAQEILEIPLVPGDDDFVKTASMQKDLVISLLNTGVKVDENRFKKRQGDALTGILAGLLEREKKMGPLLNLSTDTAPN